jgi:hypothetical protein
MVRSFQSAVTAAEVLPTAGLKQPSLRRTRNRALGRRIATLVQGTEAKFHLPNSVSFERGNEMLFYRAIGAIAIVELRGAGCQLAPRIQAAYFTT